MWIQISKILIFTSLNPLLNILAEENSQIPIHDVNWLVGIYSKSVLNPKLFYYKCQGIVIHYKVVLAPSSCLVSDLPNMEYVIRVYHWALDQKSTSPSNFKSYNVLKIYHYSMSNSYDYKQKSNSLSFLLIEKTLPLVLYYPFDGQDITDTIDSKKCVIVHIKNKNEAIPIKQYNAFIQDNKCNGTLFKDISASDSNYFVQVKTDKFFCSDYEGGTLFCQSQHTPGKYLLTGLLINNDGCNSLHIKIKEYSKIILDYLYVVDNYWRTDKFDVVPSPQEFSVKFDDSDS
ncbi:uncharacterized protein LOC103574523 [Microplitis demolitor]|uniref:uncharacterized protein LOC103574523 n=1 Tax=Microplitis demolitor TaxID=69319 RepID=UPI0004CCA3F2|nr:uncharacterized protein LOC103574523 [Microplitis demolitor]